MQRHDVRAAAAVAAAAAAAAAAAGASHQIPYHDISPKPRPVGQAPSREPPPSRRHPPAATHPLGAPATAALSNRVDMNTFEGLFHGQRLFPEDHLRWDRNLSDLASTAQPAYASQGAAGPQGLRHNQEPGRQQFGRFLGQAEPQFGKHAQKEHNPRHQSQVSPHNRRQLEREQQQQQHRLQQQQQQNHQQTLQVQNQLRQHETRNRPHQPRNVHQEQAQLYGQPHHNQKLPQPQHSRVQQLHHPQAALPATHRPAQFRHPLDTPLQPQNPQQLQIHVHGRQAQQHQETQQPLHPPREDHLFGQLPVEQQQHHAKQQEEQMRRQQQIQLELHQQAQVHHHLHQRQGQQTVQGSQAVQGRLQPAQDALKPQQEPQQQRQQQQQQHRQELQQQHEKLGQRQQEFQQQHQQLQQQHHFQQPNQYQQPIQLPQPLQLQQTQRHDFIKRQEELQTQSQNPELHQQLAARPQAFQVSEDGRRADDPVLPSQQQPASHLQHHHYQAEQHAQTTGLSRPPQHPGQNTAGQPDLCDQPGQGNQTGVGQAETGMHPPGVSGGGSRKRGHSLRQLSGRPQKRRASPQPPAASVGIVTVPPPCSLSQVGLALPTVSPTGPPSPQTDIHGALPGAAETVPGLSDSPSVGSHPDTTAGSGASSSVGEGGQLSPKGGGACGVVGDGSGLACAHCELRFATRELRRAHVRSAHGRRFSCPVCPSSFTRRFDLDKHALTVHERRRPFACEVCFVSFGQKHHMIRHMRAVHNKVKEFECQTCAARFARKEHLFNHRRSVHDKFKPFLCCLCDSQYSERRALKRHLEEVHSVKNTRSMVFAGWQPGAKGSPPAISDVVRL